MKERTTEVAGASSPTWAAAEAFARTGVQRLLQQVPEEEDEQVLGRGRNERQPSVVVTSLLAHRGGGLRECGVSFPLVTGVGATNYESSQIADYSDVSEHQRLGP